jgi:nucleotide-binding universal stress UspA family protein
MTLVVPFDSSELAQTALFRAVQFDSVLDEGVAVVSVIPSNNAQYAKEQGWLTDDESFDGEKITNRLREQVTTIAPDARFEYVVVSQYAQAGEIASKIRKFARQNDTSIVFIGSENAGRIHASVSSVGNTVSSSPAYDTMLISQVHPNPVEKLEETIPTEDVIDPID